MTDDFKGLTTYTCSMDCTAGASSLLYITMRHPRSQPSWNCQYTTAI